MARGKLYTDEERSIIWDMYCGGAKPAEILRELKQHGYERSAKQLTNHIYDSQNRLPRTQKDVCEMTFDGLDELRAKLIDVNRDYSSTAEIISKRADTKVLILTDLHIPFEQQDVIEHALTEHGDADILVLGGDFLDAYAVSKFRKSKAILFRWEYEIAVEWLRIFSSIFGRIVLVSGNHERRVQRYVADNLGNMLHGLVQDDPLRALADGMDYGDDGKLIKLQEFDNVYYEGYPRGDYARIGQLIVAHPDSYSSVPMRTTINVAEAMIGLEDYQCLVLGHTHAMGSLVWRNRLLMEAGCCCMPLEYTFSSGKVMKNPQTFGYVVAHLDEEGNVDFASTYPVYRGIGRVIKPAVLDLGSS